MSDQSGLEHAGDILKREALRLWRYDANNLTLTYFNDRGHWTYEIDLERCRTSAAVLDWLCQVSKKRWCNERVLAGLVHAFNAVLDPQATLCGCGVEHGPIDIPARLHR